MEKQFALAAALCKIGKISNNLEKHGTEDVTEFNLPVFALVLDGEKLGQLYGDPYTERGWFNINGEHREPMNWARAASPLTSDAVFDNIEATIKLPSDEELEFSNCRAKDFKFTPVVGGTDVEFKLQLCPGLGRENLLLQEYQNHEVRLSIDDAKVAVKKKTKQGELPLAGGGANKDGEGSDSTDSDTPADPTGDALADTDRLLTKLAELGVRPGVESLEWTERHRAVVWEWVLAFEANGADCKISRPHWLPIPDQAAA